MILEALHTTLNAIDGLNAYPLIGDFEAVTPFSVFRADAGPVRDKAGVSNYRYLVEVGIVDADISVVNTYTESVRAAMLAMSGTINDTEIVNVIDTDESGIYYSNADNVYINDLEFLVFTTNR